MNRITNLFAAAVVTGSAAVATAAIDVDGYTWDYAYTGDALPEASSPAWNAGGSGSATVSSGELTIDTITTDTKYYEAGAEWNPTTSSSGAYLQFRVKANAEVAGVRFVNTLFQRADGSRIDLNFGDNINSTVGIYDQNLSLITAVDIYQYHTYRVRFNSNTDQYTLWIDDFSGAGITNALPAGSGSDYMYFGDGSGDLRGSMTWDYIAWKNEGAPVAVPEPAGLSLLAISALAAVRRRRA